MYIWNLIRWLLWLYMWDRKRDRDVLSSLLDSVGEGQGGMIWENSIEPCILSYVKWITSPSSMHETGCSGLVHWDDPEGWDGVQDGVTCTPMADSCQCMAKTTASAAVKSLQSCPTMCEPIDGSTPGSPFPGILQARTLEWVAISFSSAWKWKVKVKSLSRVRFLATAWTVAYQAPPSMGFSRQEYWSGLPLPSLQKPLEYCKAITLQLK